MFWKRFYFVVILLSCNCFLLCSNWFCEFVKKLCTCWQPADEDEGIPVHSEYVDGQDNNNNSKFIFKCLFLSNTACVGKTSIFNYTVNKIFVEDYCSTVGVDLFAKFYIEEGSGAKIKIQIWDCSGAERYCNLVWSYLSKAKAIVFVYDITSKKFFDSLEGYITGVKEKAPGGCLLFLLGNKLDLDSEGKRQVATDEAQKLAADNDLIFLGECSAKTDTYIPAQGELYCKQNGFVKEGVECTEGLNGMLKDITCHIYKTTEITNTSTSQIKLIETEPFV